MKAILFPAIIYLMCFYACCDEEVNQAELTDFCTKAIVPLGQDSSDYSAYYYNRAKWNCHSINHYSFIQSTEYGICIRAEHLIEVLNNEIIHTELLNSDIIRDTASLFCYYFTIDDYFDRIRDATDERIPIPRTGFYPGGPLYLAQKVEVSYDAKYSYPLKGIIDYHFGVADDEFPFELKEFKVLE